MPQQIFSESQNKVQNTNDNKEDVSGARPAQQKIVQCGSLAREGVQHTGSPEFVGSQDPMDWVSQCIPLIPVLGGSGGPEGQVNLSCAVSSRPALPT